MFARIASGWARAFGSPVMFSTMALVIVVWAVVLGPVLRFSDSWQLWINTPTTILELFAAISIQYVSNRIEGRQAAQLHHIESLIERIDQVVEHEGNHPCPPSP